MQETTLMDLMTSLALRAPFFIVYVIGLTLALSRRDKHPRASQYVMLASIGLLIETFFAGITFTFLPRAVYRSANTMESARWIMTGASCFFTLISALLQALLIAAVFVDRRDPMVRPTRSERRQLDEPTAVDETMRGESDPSSTAFRDRPPDR